MIRYVLFLWFAAEFISPKPVVLQQEFSDLLLRSEALYYEAKFSESLRILTNLDDSLQSMPDRVQDKVNVKLQLALAYLALNDVEKAKSNFTEMCALDTGCSIDARKYPPKVLNLFQQAKTEYLTDLPYRQGLEAFKRDDAAEAVRKFHEVLKQDPENALATQYLTLADEKLRLEIDQKVLTWRKDFNAGDIKLATIDYHQLMPLNIDGMADTAVDQIRTEYRNAVKASLDAWNRACDGGDSTAMNHARTTAIELLPDQSLGEDLLSQMETCTSTACLRQTAETALLRVKSSREPEIPFAFEKILQKPSTRTVRVEARIDENGDVTVLSLRGENPTINDAVRSAVTKWKFVPVILENKTRCVETFFPIVITRFGPN
jgi:tetratricopeptide (TPR) repeat protein